MADGYGNKNAVSATDQDAQYDDKAKRLLGNKIILAHILVKTVDEFRGMNPKDVVSYIEGGAIYQCGFSRAGADQCGKGKSRAEDCRAEYRECGDQ